MFLPYIYKSYENGNLYNYCVYVTHGMRTRRDVKGRELLLQATTYSILIVDISLEKYTKKVERKKKNY